MSRLKPLPIADLSKRVKVVTIVRNAYGERKEVSPETVTKIATQNVG